VLVLAEEYFGIDHTNLIAPQNEDDQEAQDKCVKAMLKRGASRPEIWNTFGITVGDNQWIDDIDERVTDDDGDLDALMKEPEEEAEEPVRVQTKPAPSPAPPQKP